MVFPSRFRSSKSTSATPRRSQTVMERADAQVVIHLAALHFIPACNRDPQRAIRVNVDGTQGVLKAAADAASVVGVVVASTAAVYAPSTEAHSESSTIGPTDIYGLTKLWSEQLAELFARSTGKSVGIARLFNVFGPGETNPHLIPTIVRQLQQGPELRLGNLSTKRDYVYVEDVARGLIALAESVRRRRVADVQPRQRAPVRRSRGHRDAGSPDGARRPADDRRRPHAGV